MSQILNRVVPKLALAVTIVLASGVDLLCFAGQHPTAMETGECVRCKRTIA